MSDASDVTETRIATRWVDFDPAGHVTDATYPIFFGQARGEFLTARVGPFTEWPCVLAHASIDYRREIAYPATGVTVRTRIDKVGASSVSFDQQIVRDDGEVAAEGHSVLVAWDTEKRGPRAIGDDDRARLLGT